MSVGGSSVTTFRIATNRTWRDGAGAQQQATDWHTIVAWGTLAETCAQHLAKGRLVFVTGRIQTRSYADREDVTRYATEIVASEVQFLNGKRPEADSAVAEAEPADEIPF